MRIELHPRQSLAFTTSATEVLYGGAAGGGKSYLLRVSAIRWCLEVPGIQVYLFRRTLPDLRANHLRGPTSFFYLLADYIESGAVSWKSQENEFVFKSGSRISLNYCQYEDQVTNHLGAEIHVLMVDELTLFTEYMYRFLRSRVRAIGLKIPAKYKDKLPRIESASNPGSIGHAWVKRSFVTSAPQEVMHRASEEDGGMLRQFIPAKLSDNPSMERDDPSYRKRLLGLGAEHLVRAMLDGDWDIVAGQAFEKLRKDIHGIAPFQIPRLWTRFRAMDWGSSKPFAVYWFAVSDGLLTNNVWIPPGALVVYKEWYGWNGTPDQGLRLEVADVARGIVERSEGEKYTFTVADPAMWKVDGGISHAETMGRHGVVMIRADNARKAGYLEMRGRIAGDVEGNPMIFVFDTCQQFWRTVPDLVLEDGQDEVDTTQEDHAYDAVRYGVMSRPYIAREKPVKYEPKPYTMDWLRKLSSRNKEKSAYRL